MSSNTMRTMPKSGPSATDSALMLMFWSRSTLSISARRPGWFSTNTETCLIIIPRPPSRISGRAGGAPGGGGGAPPALRVTDRRLEPQVPTVNDPLRFALASLDALRLHELDAGGDAQHALKLVAHALGEPLQAAHLVGENLLRDLHPDLHIVQVALPIYNNN